MTPKNSGRCLCVLAATLLHPLSAHRLDEYLQGAILSLEKDQVQAQLTLTPGSAIFPALISKIDTDNNGQISSAEQQSYAKQVLSDLSLTLDGHRLTPQLRSIQFPTMDEMQEGRGEIQLDITADLPAAPHTRNLIFENFHQPNISVYQVNTLVPRDPNIRIAKQDRNYTQSRYRLEYEQGAAPLPPTAKVTAWLLAAAALLRLAWLFITSQRRRWASARTDRLAPS